MEESDIAEEPRAAGAGGGFTEESLRIYERMRESYGFSLDSNDLAEVNSQPLTSVRQSCRFYRLDELMYEGKCPQREAFAKVLSALNEPGFNFVYIIRGDGHGTHVYLGVAVRPGSPEVPQLGDFFKDVLSHSFQAEFRGSRLANLLESDISREIMEPRGEMPYMSMVIGIPSLKDDSGRREGDPDFQSIDRLASAMHGDTWQMVVVCEPMRREDITSMRQEAYRIYEALSLRAKNSAQIQHSVNESAGENKGHTEGSGTTLSSGSSQSVTKGNTESESFSDTRNSSQSVSRSEGLSETNTKSQSHSTGNSWSATNGQSVEHGVQDSCSGSGTGSSSSDLEDGIGISLSIQSSNSHTETSSVSDSYSETKSGSESWTDGTSQSVSRSTTNGTTDTTGSSNTHQTGRGTSSSTSETENHGRSDSENRSDSHSTSRSRGTSDSLSASFDVVRKKDAEELKYIDESLLPRLRSGESSGMFKTAVYLSAREPSTLNRLQSNIKSIFQSGEVGFSPLTVEPLANGSGWMDDFQIHSIDSPQQSEMAAFYGIMAKGGRIDLASCLTLEEVSLMAGMPQHEVPGLTLTPYTPFGLNTGAHKNGAFAIGQLVYGGQAQARNQVELDRDVLNKHVFVTGITGSGKTMTCKQLLSSSGMNFLVIEPAKTEYRELILLRGLEDTIVFSVGDERRLPLRFNPFELLDGENLTSHIDMVKAAFVSSFDFEASMPQIFEMAIYRSYARCGWDTDTGEFTRDGEKIYPTLTEFLERLDEVVREQKFGPELEGNYRGSLISRIKNLTCGAKGRMLNCPRSVDFTELLHHHVVLEMEELKSPQDKALIMALVMGRLAEAVKIEYRRDRSFRHITLVEEAHRLLTKVVPGDGESQKYSVGVFTDMLAEIRKYGESLIIVDQIPNKLSEDVLKNTATKIVHKLLARDDKEVIGDTMMLDEAQKTFLSNLRTGQAIVFTENWSKAVCTEIGTIRNVHQASELEKRMEENAIGYKASHIMAYYPELGLGATRDDLEYYQKVTRRWPKIFPALRQILGRWGKDPERQEAAMSQLPTSEEATPELADLCERLFYENAAKKLADVDFEEMKRIILDLLQRKSKDEMDEMYGRTLVIYGKMYQDYFRERRAR